MNNGHGAPSPIARSAIGSIDNVRADAVGKFTKATADLEFVRGDLAIVRGWIATAPDALTAAQHVRVTIDDAIEATVQSNVPRADVAVALQASNLLHCGFLAVLSTARLEPGRHRLSVSVQGAIGEPLVAMPASCSFQIRDDAPLVPDVPICGSERIHGSIDTWAALPRVTDQGTEIDIYVRGWACDLVSVSPACAVFGIAESSYSARAITGFYRPDVAKALQAPSFEACGFRLRMALPAALVREGSIEIVALSGDRLRRGPVQAVKSKPRLPAFAPSSHDASQTRSVGEAWYERAVLDDVLEFDRLEEEIFGITFA